MRPTARVGSDSSESRSLHLTEQEWAVARLVAEGCSDSGIAAELDITIKTVNVHLSNIYRTLGWRRDQQVNRRVKLAALLWGSRPEK